MTNKNFAAGQQTDTEADDKLFRNAVIAYAIIEALFLIPVVIYLMVKK